jgi:hypothetical protein
MSEKKTSTKEVIQRLDELIRILKFLSEDLIEISKNLKSSINILNKSENISKPKSSQQTITFKQPISTSISKISTVNDVVKIFPKDLSDKLNFEVKNEYILVKPKQYLGSDNFRRIAEIIRDQLQGEYVSAGRDSHFRIQRKV